MDGSLRVEEAWVVAVWFTPAVLAFIAAGWLYFHGRTRDADGASAYERDERARMPDEVANGKLILSEKTVWRRGARPFPAKTDQAFLTPDGRLVLVETKARHRVSGSDVVQISAQAVAIAEDPGMPFPMATYGYIRLAPNGRHPIYCRVNLAPVEYIDRLWDRWSALKRGAATPILRPAKRRCEHCGFRNGCPAHMKQSHSCTIR